MNKIIEIAIQSKNETYEKHIEKVFQIVESRILLDSKYGMTSTLLTESDFFEYGRELQILFLNNIERLINDLAEQLEIDKDLIKRVYAAKKDGEARINAIQINWSEANDK